MENIENKIIRDKINTIENLPKDYTPFIDSKFELLMAGIPEPSKKRKRIWIIIPWGVAAGIALLLMLNQTSNEKKIITSKAPTRKQISSQNDFVVKTGIQKKDIVNKKKQEKNINLVDTDTIYKKENFVLIQEPNKTAEYIIPPIINDSFNKSAIVKIEKTNPAKLKRHRFAEIDFNENSTTEPVIESTAKRLKVDFKFNVTNNIVQTPFVKPLQFKKDF
jgi:hypothetical protein